MYAKRVMKFNSKSVTLNRGVNHRVPVILPDQLQQYEIPEQVWTESIAEFNKLLDRRPAVHTELQFLQRPIKVDVLRMHRTSGGTTLWLMVKEADIDQLDRFPFKITGEVVFAENSDTKVDKMVIENLIYGMGERLFKAKT